MTVGKCQVSGQEVRKGGGALFSLKHTLVMVCLLSLETGFLSVTQAGLYPIAILLRPPVWWDYRYQTLCPAGLHFHVQDDFSRTTGKCSSMSPVSLLFMLKLLWWHAEPSHFPEALSLG